MSAKDIFSPKNPFPRQEIRICVSTKLFFQPTLRRYFGKERLGQLNATIDTLIFLVIYHCLSLDVFLFFCIEKEKKKKKRKKKKRKKKKRRKKETKKKEKEGKK